MDREEPGGEPSSALSVDDEQDVPVDADRLRDLAGRMLRALGVPVEAQLSVTLVGPARMAELKERALGTAEPTDVLSFPIDSLDDPSPGPMVLGDVVICPAVAGRHARALGRSLEDEMAQLLVHGILHLLGRDHADTSGERSMWAEERRVLSALGAWS